MKDVLRMMHLFGAIIHLHNRVMTPNLHQETAGPRHRPARNRLLKLSHVVALCCPALLCGCTEGSSKQTNPFFAAITAEADRQLNDFVNSGKAPGVVISVTSRPRALGRRHMAFQTRSITRRCRWRCKAGLETSPRLSPPPWCLCWRTKAR